MSELTLNQKFQKLTGINCLDVEKYISEAEDKGKAFNEIQWKIAKGAMREPELIRDKKSYGAERLNLYAEVMKGLADLAGNDYDIDNSGTTGDTPTEAKIQDTMSNVDVILDGGYGYDDEDESGNTSSQDDSEGSGN